MKARFGTPQRHSVNKEYTYRGVYVPQRYSVNKEYTYRGVYVPQRHSVNKEYTYRGVYVFLTSALDGGEWPASRPSRFTPRDSAPPRPQWIGGCLYTKEFSVNTQFYVTVPTNSRARCMNVSYVVGYVIIPSVYRVYSVITDILMWIR
jgi:hypothetical protein